MKQIFTIISLLTALLLLVSCKPTMQLPNQFTLVIHTDTSSASGERGATTWINYEGDEAVGGHRVARYSTYRGLSRCEGNLNVDTRTWEDKWYRLVNQTILPNELTLTWLIERDYTENCNNIKVYYTRQEVLRAIEEGELVTNFNMGYGFAYGRISFPDIP